MTVLEKLKSGQVDENLFDEIVPCLLENMSDTWSRFTHGKSYLELVSKQNDQIGLIEGVNWSVPPTNNGYVKLDTIN
jgi:hypothetical protein